MSNRLYVSICLFLAMMQFAGCAAPPPPERVTVPERVTLLPQPDGSASAIVVQSKTGGTTVLDRPYMVATVTEKQLGLEQTGEAAVKLRYKELFDALPARPKSYLLLFDFGGIRLTPDSAKILQVMLSDLKDFPAPELIIIGHTDAVGTDAFNDELSRQRANSVVEMIKAKGIETKRVSAVGRGSRDPLVPSRKGVPEAKNRRVEIRLK